jgi:hypothetical protein
MPYPKPRVRPTGESLAQVKTRLIHEQRQRTVARQRQLLAEVNQDEDVQDSNIDNEEDEQVTQAQDENRVRDPSYISIRVLCFGVCLVLSLSVVIAVFVAIELFIYLERRQEIRDEL